MGSSDTTFTICPIVTVVPTSTPTRADLRAHTYIRASHPRAPTRTRAAGCKPAPIHPTAVYSTPVMIVGDINEDRVVNAWMCFHSQWMAKGVDLQSNLPERHP